MRRRIALAAVAGLAALLAMPGTASARRLAIVITENEGLSAAESDAALLAALDVLTGNVDLGEAPEKVAEALKARGADPLKCRGDVACIAQLGVDASAAYVLALGVGAITGDYPLSATLVDVAHRKVAARKSFVLQSKPDWPEAMRDLLRQTLPEGVIRYESRLRITADVADAEVFVDGKRAGNTPLSKPIPVTAGSHEIRVAKAGYRAYVDKIDVEPTGSAQIEAKLPLLPPLEEPSPYRPARIAAIGVGGLSVAGIVVSVVMQLRVNDASNAFVQTCQGWAIDPTTCTSGGPINLPPSQQSEYVRLQRLQDNESAARTRFAVTLGITIAVAATGGVLAYYDLTHGPPVAVAVGPSGLVISGRF